MIRVEELTKAFRTTVAIKHLSFSIGKGEVVGLLGENGAGKTTTLRLIASVLKPTSGRIEVAGFDTVRQAREVKKRVGILFGGETGLYDRLTARENIAYFARLYELPEEETEQRITRLADIFDMYDFLDRPVGGVSKGMRQRVAIARSIVHDPEIILFDEPTSGLDIIAANDMRGLIRHFSEQGKTVVFSSHIMSEVQKLCQRVLILHRGELRFDGTLEALYAAYGHDDLDRIFLAEIGRERHV
ncbi:ABC transporter related protein [Caldalkalibacillus thermarum TA2.A1]|uniref:ABC transporter related protein n=1 Tax=Caldalkalibacillus thermarum (strain TA2.A1) TaxID=986075 RepID=F5L6H1_CALTT|nr:ATP-binding cassette domain-containing protein [Caldalkalibacillus thermarum]EGL83081.1 ABC transporter related protein [Caldalkalibacillus thermarum TA2.A1]QZT34916.1 ATP-binding cassette domain-containing protein [Caldalkalibacillus thermarum TA2.A1]GGK11140.1 ABC transporter ATP-binding protein NatA [Caldalkalibacillus thermarum]